jgi:integrase/recombinase XerD
LIKQISLAVNKDKITYRQLRYIFREVRQRCELEVPDQRRRKLKELPSKADLRAFYDEIEQPTHKLIFETLENTGLRVSELCNLLVERIDFETNLVFVNEGKGKKDRVTVMGNRLKEKLKIYLDNRKNRYLFETNRFSKFSPRRIEQLCMAYKIAAKISRDLTPHTMRHIWNTRLAEAGLTEEKRALLAGHENQETQKIYTHLGAGGFKGEVIAILDTF